MKKKAKSKIKRIKHRLELPKVWTISQKEASQSSDSFPIKHISASAMVKFSSNPLLFKVEYMNGDRIEMATNAAAVLGRAFHFALEVYSGGSDTLIPTNEQEAIEYGMKAGSDYIEKYNDGFINWSKIIPTKQALLDRFIFAYLEYVKYTPYVPDDVIAVEEEISEQVDVEWRGQRVRLPVRLKGFLDKVYREDGKIKIKDYKTCYAFSNVDKIDGAKMIQAVEYYLLAYAKYGEAPHSIVFDEIKYSKNSNGEPQVRSYEMIYEQNDLYFDFYFRFYSDFVRALNGEQVFVPNVNALFDNEVAIIAYIHRLDVTEETAKLMKKHRVDNVTDLLKKQIQKAGNLRKLLKSVEEKFASYKNLNYATMTNEQKIQTKMLEHGISLQFDSKVEGSSVDLYRFTPSIGVKMARLAHFVPDVEQVLGKSGIRILAPIPDSSLIGFEVPREVRSFPELPESNGLNLAIGETLTHDVRRYDLRDAPHMLVAGASGSGKSVWLTATIKQLTQANNVELYLFDPKIVELAPFKDAAEVYASDAVEIKKHLSALVSEMKKRYKTLAARKARNIEGTGIPYKVVIIDEFADLIMSESVSASILMLAQQGRAAGIHLIIATQTPRAEIISGPIKANFPVKVVFRTAKAIDSRVVIDEAGSEKLLGKGDMLFASEKGLERLQGFNA